jgi:hypothetical protein
MFGGDAEHAIAREGEFSSYSDTELLNELSRMANDLGIKVTLTLESPSQPRGDTGAKRRIGVWPNSGEVVAKACAPATMDIQPTS